MNDSIGRMSSFIVMDVLEKAQEMESAGEHVIHLEVGEPDFDIPECAGQAARQAYEQGKTHYTHSLGNPRLREEIARFYGREYGVSVDPECIVVTSGSSPAILMTVMLLCEPGGEVIVSNPGYSSYRNFVLACSGVPVEVDLRAEEGFRFDISSLKKAVTPRTRAVFINSPMNPTGTILSDSQMIEIASLGVPIVSDEIYHGLVYGTGVRSMLEFTDNTFILNGFSKRFAMTGLRLGYLIAPEKHMRSLQILQQNLFICAPSTAQQAGIAALREGKADVDRMRSIYNERRRYMLGRLKDMGFTIHTEPQGAFYIFADVRAFTDDCYRFAFDVLEKARVGITPGIDFGSNGEGFVRFSYANSIDNIREGMDRLEKYLSEIKKTDEPSGIGYYPGEC